jgi:hypothetical protein
MLVLATILASAGLLPLVADDGPCVQAPAVPNPGQPFGYVDGLRTGSNAASGVVGFGGWALDDDGVTAVDVTVDGVVVGRSLYGGPTNVRADVTKIYPGFPDSAAAGFAFQLDTTNHLNGLHSVSALVLSDSGEVRRLNAVDLEFLNTTHNLKPFGVIGFPEQNAEMVGICDIDNPVRRYTVIEGWALDAGVEINDHGVSWVELMLDGSLLLNTRTDCHHSPITGAFTNCYGLPRQDIQERYGSLKDAPRSGYRFVLDIGALIAFGWNPGHHELIVRVGDVDSQIANIDSITTFFTCDDFFGNQASFGDIDPISGLQSGLRELSGWALDWEGVFSVAVHIDGESVGFAAYGFPSPVITSRYPGFPDSALPAWLFDLSTVDLSDGPHEAQVFVRDIFGDETLIAEHPFTVSNP